MNDNIIKENVCSVFLCYWSKNRFVLVEFIIVLFVNVDIGCVC